MRLGRIRFRLILALSIIAALITLFAIGLANAQAMPTVRRASIKMPGMLAGSAPIRVALLSDIHLGNWGMTSRKLDLIVEQVNAAHPDLIVIAGDFVTGHDPTGVKDRASALVAPLSRLRATFGVIAVLGNHDHWTDPEAVRSALDKAHVVTIDNERVRRGPLTVVGVGDRFSNHDDLPRLARRESSAGATQVVLTHSPDVVPDLPAGLPLVLAGHTHCGQVVLPWIGPLLTRAPFAQWRRLYNPRYRCGLIRDTGRLTIVSAGLGSGTVPLRLWAMPDWWLLSLHP